MTRNKYKKIESIHRSFSRVIASTITDGMVCVNDVCGVHAMSRFVFLLFVHHTLFIIVSSFSFAPKCS